VQVCINPLPLNAIELNCASSTTLICAPIVFEATARPITLHLLKSFLNTKGRGHFDAVLFQHLSKPNILAKIIGIQIHDVFAHHLIPFTQSVPFPYFTSRTSLMSLSAV